MLPEGCPLTPSSSLPPLRSLATLSKQQLLTALQQLKELYCPLAFDINPASSKKEQLLAADSGYVSETEGDDADDALTALRADGFERSFAERWLTGFLARSEELGCFESDDERERAVEQASFVLESFYVNPAEEEQKQEELAHYFREFTFDLTAAEAQDQGPITVRLNDGLAGQNSDEPDDVGLQSWGASIIFSRLLCAAPERYGLSKSALPKDSRIIDLGAGTGLVSLVLGDILPILGLEDTTIVATDYHPAVLANLEANIDTNFANSETRNIQAALLDWSSPSHEAPLDQPANVLLATDVVYAPQHAVWLRDCATEFLAADGVFWLFATMRETGKFEGVSDTVETAFKAEDRPTGPDGRRLTIMNIERLEKTKGVGRGDENGYKVFKIEWA